MSWRIKDSVKGLAAALFAGILISQPARGAFHLWNIQEIYTNSSGSLQFIELKDNSGGQPFVGGQSIQVSNVGNTQSHSYTIGESLPSSPDTFGHTFLIGTAGLQAAGAPKPDYIMPDNFLFAAGGTISFFGANSGGYTAMPTDGALSRTWNGGNAVNSPQNFAGQVGTVAAPEPTVLALGGVFGGFWLLRRRAVRKASAQA